MARVLMIAYSCEPEASSEGTVGWELASRLARRHQVTLITRPTARAAIEERRAKDASMDLAVEYHEMGALRRLKYMGLPVSNLRYLAWNHRLTDRVGELEANHDLVHHTTWVRHWMPSAAAGAEHIPFVWGPVGAAERTPSGLLRTMGPRGLAGEMARLVGPKVISLDPQMRQTYGRVDAAVASSHETATLMRAHGVRTWLAPSVGFDPAEFNLGDLGEPVHDFVSVGRLLDWKGFQLGLRALAELDDPSSRYLVVGDGPAERRLRSLSEELGVDSQVEFAGRLPRREVLRRMGQSSMLVHPSFHDSGGFVVVEAMALGVPVVCLDIGGPPFLAGDGGIAIDPSPASTVVQRLARAMATVHHDREAYSERARARAAETLDWERIVDTYDRVYDTLLAGDPESATSR
jgi:glycosyltransferase involved in cell wall biosynthesis